MTIADRLKSVYNATGKSELKVAYDDWATEFDRDCMLRAGRQAFLVGGLAARFLQPSDAILDAGAGTGLVGEFLSFCGFENLVGIDISPEMLAVAEQKNAYQKLLEGTLGEPLSFDDDTFSAVVSAGVFTHGHAPPESLHELIRVTRPGGHVIFSVNSQVLEDGFHGTLRGLENLNQWKPTYRTGPHAIMATDISDATALFFVYQVV